MNFRNIKYSLTLSAAVAMVCLNACRDPEALPGYEFMPDMYRGPAVETYEPAFDGDSTTSRTPVAGTIPRGFTYFNYPNTPEGYALAGEQAHNPLSNDTASLETNMAEGKRMYDIYCVNCHGSNGAADGSIVSSGKFPPPPNYSTGTSSRGGMMKDLTDGKIYHTITYGINMMGSHASQIQPVDRWRIVMYVRKLQGSGVTAAAPKDTTVAAAKM